MEQSEGARHPPGPERDSNRPGDDGLPCGRCELVEVAQERDDEREREQERIAAHSPATVRRRRPRSRSSRITMASPQTTTIPVATVRERLRPRSKP